MAFGGKEAVARSINMPLRYLDDESMRGGTLVQLNRGEGRHGLSRIVFHSKRGERVNATARARKISSARWTSWST